MVILNLEINHNKKNGQPSDWLVAAADYILGGFIMIFLDFEINRNTKKKSHQLICVLIEYLACSVRQEQWPQRQHETPQGVEKGTVVGYACGGPHVKCLEHFSWISALMLYLILIFNLTSISCIGQVGQYLNNMFLFLSLNI